MRSFRQSVLDHIEFFGTGTFDHSSLRKPASSSPKRESNIIAPKNAFIAPILGLAAGLAIGYVDSRPNWDDTGITAGAVFVAAAVLATLRPNLFWLTGLTVGLPVLVMNAALNANFGSAVAVVISLVGSVVGYRLRKLLGFGDTGRAKA